MTAVLRVHEIIHVAIGLPIRWLIAKTYDLGEYNWGMLLTRRVVDTLYYVYIEIYKDGRNIIGEDFIMNIIDDIGKDIPELKKLSGVFI